MEWYQKGVTNYGQWVTPPVGLDFLDDKGRWRLIFALPDVCESGCEAALFQLSQIPKALGRKQARVQSITLTSDANQAALQQLPLQVLAPSQWQQMKTLPYAGNTIYLVDPLNALILAYPIAVTKAQQIEQSQGLMKDLRKLMKLSKAG